MTEAQIKAFRISVNRMAEFAEWDNDLLALEFAELTDMGFDLDLTGFMAEEIQALEIPDFEPATEDEQGKLDQLDPKWIACPHCGKEFDIREA
jgi:hypothetical protein